LQQQKNVRRGTLEEAGWIVDLSDRVQKALSAVGSLQVIGPLSMDRVQSAAEAGYAYLLEVDGRRVGSVLVEPLPDNSPFLDEWQLRILPAPLWFLSKLMLEPDEQSKGFGLDFLAGVKELVTPDAGTILLDCWAGSDGLRDFYRRADFILHGVFPLKNFEVAVFVYTPLVYRM
jgi:hypothetical protein